MKDEEEGRKEEIKRRRRKEKGKGKEGGARTCDDRREDDETKGWMTYFDMVELLARGLGTGGGDSGTHQSRVVGLADPSILKLGSNGTTEWCVTWLGDPVGQGVDVLRAVGGGGGRGGSRGGRGGGRGGEGCMKRSRFADVRLTLTENWVSSGSRAVKKAEAAEGWEVDGEGDAV